MGEIAGDQIRVEVRIIAVADAYESMTSRRCYRIVMPQEKVRSQTEKGEHHAKAGRIISGNRIYRRPSSAAFQPEDCEKSGI